MNDQFEQFRQIHAAQERVEIKSKIIRTLGGAIEEAIKGRFDEMELRHPEILDKILELHLLLTYEAYPQLEPPKQPDPSPGEAPVEPPAS
jgi:hypothetical protein